MKSFCPTGIADYQGPREPLGITLPVLLGLGQRAAGAATGSSAFKGLQAAINADIQGLENSISILQESLTSLSEIVLQNRRGLELLFLQRDGLCATLRGEWCFYGDHSGVVKDSMARVREGLAKRENSTRGGMSLGTTLPPGSPV